MSNESKNEITDIVTLETIAASLSGIDRRLNGIENRLGTVESKLDALDLKIDDVKEEILISVKRQFDEFGDNMSELRLELKADIEHKFNSVFR